MGVFVVIGPLLVLVGVILSLVALWALFGVWAGVLFVGGALIFAGLLVPWEELTRAKPAPTPPRR